MNRRDVLCGLAGILAAGMAPASARSGVLMPVRKLWTPPMTVDGVELAPGARLLCLSTHGHWIKLLAPELNENLTLDLSGIDFTEPGSGGNVLASILRGIVQRNGNETDRLILERMFDSAVERL